MTCLFCGGSGEVEETRNASPSEANGGMSTETRFVKCDVCHGLGEVRSEADEAYEREAARAAANDFEDTDGRDWR